MSSYGTTRMATAGAPVGDGSSSSSSSAGALDPAARTTRDASGVRDEEENHDLDIERRATEFLLDEDEQPTTTTGGEGCGDDGVGGGGYGTARRSTASAAAATTGASTGASNPGASTTITRFRLLCPATRIGRVIGKEGRVIKAIRDDTGARVKVAPPTPGSDERVILVASGEDEFAEDEYEDGEEASASASGEDRDAGSSSVGTTRRRVTTAEKALFRIFDTITGTEESSSASSSALSATGSESGAGGSTNEASTSSIQSRASIPICRLLVARSQVGSLIGKGGAVIASIREESGATVRVMPSNMLPTCASRGDELLQITAHIRTSGESSDGVGGVGEVVENPMIVVKRALRLIARHLRENPVKTLEDSGRSPFDAFMNGPTHASAQQQRGKNGGGSAVAAGGGGFSMSTRLNLNGVYVPGGAEITFRLLCPVSRTGSVIGRNGEVIQQIRSETGAKVKVCERVADADERVILISSSDDGLSPLLAAQIALFRVYRCIVESSGGNDAPLPFRLLVQSSQIGCLIGKGGNIIKQIRNETRASVRVLSSDSLPACANEDDELLEIGQYPADACALGIRIVSGRLRGNIRHKAAALSAQHMDATGMDAGVPFSRAPAPAPSVFDATWQQAELMFGMTQTAYGSPLDGLLGDFHALDVSPHHQPIVASVPPESHTVHMKIPSAQIGSVLGVGGCNISVARRASKAKIKLYPGQNRSTQRLVEITGTIEQVDLAQSVIERFIASSGTMLDEFAHLASDAQQHAPRQPEDTTFAA